MSKLADFIPAREELLQSLEKKSGISRARLQQLREGKSGTLKELRALARALGLSPMEFSGQRTSANQSFGMLFRNTQADRVDQADMSILSARISGAHDLFRERNATSGKPVLLDRLDDTYECAELLAMSFRANYVHNDQEAPIFSLPSIMEEKLQVMIFRAKLNGIEGAAAVFDGQPFIFLAPRFKPRMLFTLAHELAHLLAHLDWKDGGVWVDDDMDRQFSSIEKKERFANSFASCLLMPPKGVGVALKVIRRHLNIAADQISDIELLYLSRIFGVSFQVCGFRCEALKLLPAGATQALYKTICEQHGNPEKRADEIGAPPRQEVEFPALPTALLDMAIEKVRSGDMSAGKAAMELGVSISDLYTANSAMAH